MGMPLQHPLIYQTNKIKLQGITLLGPYLPLSMTHKRTSMPQKYMKITNYFPIRAVSAKLSETPTLSNSSYIYI